jgi:hypothetical protein
MPDADDPLFPIYFSCAVTTALFVVVCAVAVVVAQRRYGRLARARGSELGGLWGGLAPAWYGGTLVFGMGGMVAGFYLLREPRTAKQGLACVVLGAVHVVVLVVGTCAAVVYVLRHLGRPILG